MIAATWTWNPMPYVVPEHIKGIRNKQFIIIIFIINVPVSEQAT
jgi:hypothetical protein